MKVLALSGWKGSGKDTLADYLIATKGARRFAFADTLKDMVASQYRIPVAMLHDPDLKEKPLEQYPVLTEDAFSATIHEKLAKELVSGFWTPRALAILEGSIKRSVNSQYWTEQVIASIKESNEELVVITDMRYNSELRILKEAFGDQLESIRIERFNESPSDDPSERDLDSATFDVTIANVGTLEDLHRQGDNL